MSNDVVIIEACRTAVGSFGGTLKPLTAADLAVEVMKGAISRSGIDPNEIDEVDFGQCRQTSDFSNIARYAALAAGIPDQIPGNTVMCACASGMLAVRDGMNSILLGQNKTVLAGGVESMTNAHFYLSNARWGGRHRHHRPQGFPYRGAVLLSAAGPLRPFQYGNDRRECRGTDGGQPRKPG